MRYILLDLKYDDGVDGQLIVSYNSTNSEIKYLFHDANYSQVRGNQAILDLMDINAGITQYSSAFGSTFEQAMSALERCCEQKYFNNESVDYIVREVPKAKVFELML